MATTAILGECAHLPAGGGEMGALVRAHDWAASPLGPVEDWPGTLRTIVGVCLHAGFPTAVLWGSDLRMIYNDSYAPFLGPRHPQALGEPCGEVWPEVWDIIGPQFEQVVSTGTSFAIAGQALTMTRFGVPEETFWDYSYSPLFIDDAVAGVLIQTHDATATVLQRRFDKLMIGLDEQLLGAGGTDAMIDACLKLIGEHLGVKRTGYGEVDSVSRTLDIRRCWTTGTMPDICGKYPLGTFGAISGELTAGRSVRIDDNRTDPRTQDAATMAMYERIGLRSGIVVPIIDRGRYAGGVFVQDDEPRSWTGAQAAIAEAAAQRLWFALTRARAETALRDSEERHRLIFEQARDIILTADLDQIVTACNPATAEAVGYTSEEIIGRSISEFVSPEDFAQMAAMMGQKLENGGTTQYELTVITRAGGLLRWEINSALAIDRDGRAVGVHAVARDVTGRRLFDERRELLISELNHRVKNTLSLVQGLAHQSFRPGSNAQAAQVDFVGRLRSLAVAHDLLTRDHWEGVSLAELVQGATAPLAGAGSRILAQGPNIIVAPKAAVALVMALHELATNAVKYGALSVAAGKVEIAWQLVDDECFKMIWTESGGPVVKLPKRRGFGVKMIERALASDLGGKVHVDFDPKGLVCSIDAPIGGAAA